MMKQQRAVFEATRPGRAPRSSGRPRRWAGRVEAGAAHRPSAVSRQTAGANRTSSRLIPPRPTADGPTLAGRGRRQVAEAADVPENQEGCLRRPRGHVRTAGQTPKTVWRAVDGTTSSRSCLLDALPAAATRFLQSRRSRRGHWLSPFSGTTGRRVLTATWLTRRSSNRWRRRRRRARLLDAAEESGRTVRCPTSFSWAMGRAAGQLRQGCF